MASPAENVAFEKPERRLTLFSLPAVQRLLPLVQRIVADLRASHDNIERMLPERENLDRHKRELAWPERSRRYQLREEIALAERSYSELQSELEGLGVSIHDANTGRVGFATIVNNQPAFFSWEPTDQSLCHWHFAEEKVLRPIPATWFQEGEANLSGNN
jgi:hypothetical protein